MRTHGGVAHVIEFQRSRFADPDTVKFTINAGVALDDVWRVYSGNSLGSTIHEADCFPRFRIGEALSGFQKNAMDVWWTIGANANSAAVAAEVKSSVVEVCIPIMDRLESVDAVFRFVLEEVPPKHLHAPFTRINMAILYHLHGDFQKAMALLEEIESNTRIGSEWRSRICDIRSRIEKDCDSEIS